MKLLIDIGNSRLKWAWYDKSTWQTAATAINSKSPAALMATVGEPHGVPRQVGLVSVAALDLLDSMKHFIKDKWNIEPVLVESVAQQAGVFNGYRDPGELGNDRWAALVAARAETTAPVCIISCGTATTIDAMNDNGEFIGGSIFPGLEMMRRNLHRGTAGIRGTAGSDQSCQATSTADAVAAGTLFGLVGAINRVVTEHHRVLGNNCVNILTGGSADMVATHLDFPVHAIPDLVLRGVKRILEERP